jgi:hypothetical protein
MAGLKPGRVLEARDLLVEMRYRQDPARGRAAAEARVMAELGPAGRRQIAVAEGVTAVGGPASRPGSRPKPSKKQRKASKRARKLVARQSTTPADSARPGPVLSEAAIRAEVDRQVREALATVQAAGADVAALSGDGLNARFLTAQAEAGRAGFWQSGPDAPATAAGVVPPIPSEEELAAMDMDQVRAVHTRQIQAQTAARGFGSPSYR